MTNLSIYLLSDPFLFSIVAMQSGFKFSVSLFFIICHRFWFWLCEIDEMCEWKLSAGQINLQVRIK